MGGRSSLLELMARHGKWWNLSRNQLRGDDGCAGSRREDEWGRKSENPLDDECEWTDRYIHGMRSLDMRYESRKGKWCYRV